MGIPLRSLARSRGTQGERVKRARTATERDREALRMLAEVSMFIMFSAARAVGNYYVTSEV